MAQRLRLASALGIAVLHRRAGWARDLGGPARLQSKEERPRPRCAGDGSRDGGKRAVARALPGEAVIEHQHLINATVPLAHQPGSRLHFPASSYPGRTGLLQVLCNLPEAALRLRTEAAESKFLHAICNSSHQQLAAQVWRGHCAVEPAPPLTKFADVELGEAQERLLAEIISPGRHCRYRSGVSAGASRYTDWPF